MASDPRTHATVTSLLNYDVPDYEDENDPFREIDTSIDGPPRNGDAKQGKKRKVGGENKENDNDDDLLGLDSEVKIVKKRAPVVKFDDERLLSEPGIPKLRALARSRSVGSKLRLKGKGHEYSDTAKLLGYYQLWLDNLYPRARFADGLQMVEKLGHGKRMQVMRKAWIDEGKPGYGRDVAEDGGSGAVVTEKNDARDGGTGELARQVNVEESGAKPKDTIDDSIFGDLDDDGTHLFFPHAGADESRQNDDEPDEDELDALLAEQGTSVTDSHQTRDEPGPGAAEEDDLDALLEEHQTTAHTQRIRPTLSEEENSKPEEEGREGELAQSENAPNLEVQAESRVLQAEGEQDELEVLLAEKVQQS